MTGRPGSSTWKRAVTFAIFSLSGAPGDLHAQQRNQQPAQRLQPEVRADYIGSRAATAQLGFGLNVPATTYVRVGMVAALGQAWSGGNATFAGRVDGLVRFVVDPVRESRWAPYAAGGIGAIYDGSEKWRAVLVGALGAEGPVTGHVVPAIEVGFGGGLRVGVALRRAMRGRR